MENIYCEDNTESPKIDVLLINPPFRRLKNIIYNSIFYFNTGYLAAALRNTCRVKIYNIEEPIDDNEDSTGQDSREKFTGAYLTTFKSSVSYKNALGDDFHPVWFETKKTFLKYRPKIIGVSSLSATYPSSLKIARIYKECIPDGVVIFGGQHPTIKTDEVLSSGYVDFVVRGEGEETIRELVPALLKDLVSVSELTKIKGISFMQFGSITHTENRSALVNLDKLDFPARDLLLKPFRDKRAYSVIITSRGCAFDCGFCSAKAIVGKKVRYRSIQNVTDEIKEVVDKYGIRIFSFWDDTFTVNRNRTIELCRALRKLGIDWQCTSRVDMVDYPLLKEMSRAGCYAIDYGVESGSESMLIKINKNVTRVQIDKAFSDSIRAGIIPNAFLMIGFPDETEEDIRKTIEFAKKANAIALCLSIFTPYPGTVLYNRAKELCLIKDDFDWRNISHQSFDNYFTQCVSRDKFKSLLYELIDSVDKHNASLYNRILAILIVSKNNPKRFIRKIINKFKKP
jgi:radical SAM superfamily enzyme YgiQ (UPF0313 family)